MSPWHVLCFSLTSFNVFYNYFEINRYGTGIDNSFLVIADQYPICVSIEMCIYPFTFDRLLGGFQFEDIIATIHNFLWTYVFTPLV